MSHFKNYALLFQATFMIGCGKASMKIEEVGPRVQQGFYAQETSGSKEVPLVAILKGDNQTEAYSFLAHNCEGEIRLSFDRTSIAFSDSVPSLSGPNSMRLDKNCKIETDIIAESDDSIQIQVKINDVAQPSYSLRRVSLEVFTEDMKHFISNTENFIGDENACMKVFGKSCESLK